MMDFTGKGNVASYCRGRGQTRQHAKRAMALGQDRTGKSVWKCPRCKAAHAADVDRDGLTWVQVRGQDVLTERAGVRLRAVALVIQVKGGEWAATTWEGKERLCSGRDREDVRLEAFALHKHRTVLDRVGRFGNG